MSEWCDDKSIQPIVVGFGNGGRGLQAKECLRLIDIRKDKETDSFLEPPERNSPLTLMSAFSSAQLSHTEDIVFEDTNVCDYLLQQRQKTNRGNFRFSSTKYDVCRSFCVYVVCLLLGSF